ncbi:Yip1 family protein [Streptomyces daliensis]|uniref:YIP1 family protein n=1 Tax=Streptomyces daliensis TaxID=299421 RepID=A0A8T4IS50_9ACTN|nr:YIP1 family protein [Streptomyces daliensis]
MAGFRMGRGRDTRSAQQHGQYPPQQAPGGAPSAYGQRAPQQPPYGAQGAWPQAGGGQGRHGGPDEPEYLGDPRAAGGYGQGNGHGHGQAPQGHGPGYGSPQGHGQGPAQDPYANNPGHTQAFSIHDPYGQGGGDGGYGDGGSYDAGGPPGPPPGPRLHWKDLLRGIVTRPNATFYQMRDYPVWGPALIVTFLYGLLAIFGLDQAREEVINATLSSAIPYVLTTAVAVVLVGLILGAVTHTLARQFGGDGAWAPTAGLSMLIMSLTDAPRLLFALFLGGTAPLVQVLGWVTWVIAGALFTSMVSRSHDLPWPKALGASAIQLIALLVLMKLGTL